MSVGGDTVSVAVRDVDDNAPVPEVEVSIDPETRVGLAFDPTGRYLHLPEWLEAPSGVGKHARAVGAFSLLVRLTEAALDDATPDPQAIRTTEISGSGVGGGRRRSSASNRGLSSPSKVGRSPRVAHLFTTV